MMARRNKNDIRKALDTLTRPQEEHIVTQLLVSPGAHYQVVARNTVAGRQMHHR
jgi:hypothetical protein